MSARLVPGGFLALIAEHVHSSLPLKDDLDRLASPGLDRRLMLVLNRAPIVAHLGKDVCDKSYNGASPLPGSGRRL